MANANAIVDKLADVGLRHGEKAGVAIATMVFLVCIGMAATKPTIDTTPEAVKKAAEGARINLDRHEERDTIIKKLEETAKIVPTKFADTVEEQINVKIASTDFTPKRDWVTPEPGAGLIRDTPKLIAPSELYAYPGRGGLLVYAIDEKTGDRIPLKEGEEETTEASKVRKYQETEKVRRHGRRRWHDGRQGQAAGQEKASQEPGRRSTARTKEERERKQRELKGLLAGGGTAKETEKSETEADKEEGGPFKQVTKGYRWVAITGTLDHGQMLANYRDALKNPAVAHPQYLRLDLQRRTLQPDGTWSDWQKVDEEKNLDILDNIPATEEELAPENVRPEGLVNPLPFLNAGLWEKVHIASLVPKEKVELPEEPKAQPGMGRGGMMGGGMGMGAQMSQAMMQQQQQNSGAMMQTEPASHDGHDEPQHGHGRRGMAGMGSSESAGNFWKSEEKRVMIRALDFTAEPNNSYRYRVRIVVVNPNYNRDDVNPIDLVANKTKKTLTGPWSKETDVVTMPPDIEPYAIATLPPTPQSEAKVWFQVIRFNPADGWTIPHRFAAGVGDVIGEFRTSEEVPRSDGTGKKREPVDYRTHQIVLDISGGGLQNLPAGLNGPSITRPALAALLRRDGAMVIHHEADDLANEMRKDIEVNYRHEIEQSSKKRENSQGARLLRV